MMGWWMAASLALLVGAAWAGHPWDNTSLPFSERAALLESALNLGEVAAQSSTYTPGTCPGVKRVDLPPFGYHSEGLHGLRDGRETVGINVTVWPQVTAMAATGNLSMVGEMARMMSTEARALYNVARAQGKIFGKGAGLFYWSPTINIGRDPRSNRSHVKWGRFQESVSEDPWLNGMYGAVFVRGMQGLDGNETTPYLKTSATCKHLAAYSLEDSSGFTRHTFNGEVSLRDMQETYLPPFQACVVGGEASQVMCSYPAINGIPACAHSDLLTGSLRSLWGFGGLVVSDQGAITDIYKGHHYRKSAPEAVAAAVSAGCDQNDGSVYAENAEMAVKSGYLNETDLRRGLRRVFTQRFRTGAFDEPSAVPWSNLGPSDVATHAHIDASRRAALAAPVLLANRKGVLPLGDLAGKKVALIGPMIDCTQCMYGAKPDYDSPFMVTLADGIKARAKGATMQVVEGCKVTKHIPSGIQMAEEAAAAADLTILAVEHEGGDRTYIGLPEPQQNLTTAVMEAAKGPVIVLLTNGGPLSPNYVSESADTVLEVFELGEATGDAVSALLMGDYSPSGILPFTVYPEEYPTQPTYTGGGVQVKMTDMSLRAGPGRTYRFYKGQPLWPFGFGLSYSSFSASWASDGPASVPIALPMRVEFSVRVENTGNVSAAKPVLAYVSTDHSSFPSLFGMQKVLLEPGEATTVIFALEAPSNSSSPFRWCGLCSVDESGERGVRGGTVRVVVGGVGGGNWSRTLTAHETGVIPSISHEFVLTGDAVMLPLVPTERWQERCYQA